MMMNACSAGGPMSVPSGSGTFRLHWITSDGLNLQAGFSWAGATSGSIDSDSQGFAEITVPAGSYVLSVAHDGVYQNDAPKTVQAVNGQVTDVYWFATKSPVQVTFLSPQAYGVEANAQYVIRSGEAIVHQGSVWGTSMTFYLESEKVHTLSLSLFGKTASKEFTPGTVAESVDISDMFCKLTFAGLAGRARISAGGGVVASEMTNDGEAYVLRVQDTLTLSAECLERYSGLDNSTLGTYTETEVATDQAEVQATMVFTGTLIILTRDGTISTSYSGSFDILMIGGGGGGSVYETMSYRDGKGLGGGGSGRVNLLRSKALVALTEYKAVIGAGGAFKSSGGATSLAGIGSASGGSPAGSEGAGGAGGAGGGASINHAGGKGYFGGGGGGGTSGGGGAGGTYGGSGGGYSNDAQDGQTPTDYILSLGYSDASGGNNFETTYRGGGGGGGCNAKGGNASCISVFTSCGGGGGIAGGDGGDGGGISTSNGAGQSGAGYGAGGGGGLRYITGDPTYFVGGGGGGGYGPVPARTRNGNNGTPGNSGCIVIQAVS